MRKIIISIFCMALVFGAIGCSNTSPAGPPPNASDQQLSTDILSTYQKAQPAPKFDWSQYRQNLIEIETAQSHTTQTTTFFFNQGVQAPIQSCPSIGFPIASTSELTNPDQAVGSTGGASNGQYGVVVLPQIDPNGIFAGHSTGTYVICIDATGKAYGNYWEGFVQTVTGPAVWDEASHQVKLTGPPSFDFSTKKK